MKVFIHDKLSWGFHNDYPAVSDGKYYEKVDPFPCARHDQKYVESLLPVVEGAFRMHPNQAPDWHLLEFEATSRTNGWSNKNWTDYGEGEWKGEISFSGKRTAIHPAMTRYLVGHEYGHIVQYYLTKQWGSKEYDDDGRNAVLKEYAKLRGLDIDAVSAYGGGNWSTNIGEIFANDFRILLAKLEIEFWPHKIERPENVKHIYGWWLEQKEKFAYKGDEPIG